MSAQVENRIPFPLSYAEGRAIIAYIRSLETALRQAKEGIEELLPPTDYIVPVMTRKKLFTIRDAISPFVP